MRTRPKAVLVSCVLFTIALLLPLPPMLEDAATWRQLYFEHADHVFEQNFHAPIGFASLAVIFIGLIVTWTGFRQRLRWAWLVMFIIASVWAFPLLLLPYLQRWKSMAPVSEWPSAASRAPALARAFFLSILIPVLMVIALLVPIKSFVRKQEGDAGLRS